MKRCAPHLASRCRPNQNAQRTGQAPGSVPPKPTRPVFLGAACTVFGIFKEYTARREAFLRAITTDEEELFCKFNPSLDNVCLYGHNNGRWEVTTYESEREDPSRLPAGPAVGLNLVRDNLGRLLWLREIAIQCDAWLMRMSFLISAHLMNANARRRLFNHISSLKTVHEAFLDSDTYQRLSREAEEKERSGVAAAVDQEEEIDFHLRTLLDGMR
ncbi:hypothetical protein EJB05_35214, partial [Eragrostis curvula]